MDFLKHIGDRIKTRILNSGYASIEIFAHENRIPKSTLSEILNGKNDPKLTTLAKICAGIGISLSDFFHESTIDSWVRDAAPKYVARHPKRKSK